MKLLENPYLGMEIEKLQDEITELSCEIDDWEYRRDYEHADMAREHRHMATEALLRICNVRF